MCGIVGAINHAGIYQHSMERIMRELLWADTLRGADATGLYCVTKENKIDWCKQVTDGWTFTSRNERAQKILRDAENHRLILGHNRSATMGAYDNTDYAHPVIIDKRIGLVHNGTLTGWPNRAYNANDKGFHHDSTAIAHVLVEGSVQDMVDTCHGAFSLVWHDVRENTVNFLRNDDRPMAMLHTDNMVFFGSELGLLMWVVQRNSLKPLKYYYTKPMIHYTFEMGAAAPVEVEIKKSYSTGRERFQGNNHGYPGSSASPIVRGNHQADYADVEPELVRSRREAERLAAELETRDQGPSQETTEGSQATGEEGVGEARRRRLRGGHGSGKPHGKQLDSWKSYKVGHGILFSCVDFGELKPHDNGYQYSMTGEPAQRVDFPEITIKATIKAAAFPQKKLQDTKKYLWGSISTIFATANGNVIMWVTNVHESQVDDVNLLPNKGQEANTDEVAEATIILEKDVKNWRDKRKDTGILLSGKDFCQGCTELVPKSGLKFLEETRRDEKGDKDIRTVFRFCETCLENYIEDRNKVVPAAARGIEVKSTTIRAFK